MSKKIPRLKVIDYVNISIFGLGLAALSTSLGQIILPMRVLDIAPESLKNTYLGILTFAGMAMAMMVQPIVGYFSDKTTLSLGKRRPYIILGTVLTTILMASIGFVDTFLGLVLVATLLQMSANIAQSPYDAVVKDQVPQSQRGRVSSVRAITGAAGAILFLLATGLLMDRHAIRAKDLWLWLALALPTISMAITMLWTILLVKETNPAHPFHELSNTEDTATGKAHPQLAWILAGGFFFTLSGGILQTYTLFFLRDVVGLRNPASAVGVLAIAVGITILVTLYPAGLLADRFGRRTLLVISASLGSVGSILFLVVENITQLVLIGMLLGVAVGIFMSAGRALITDMVSRDKAAQQLGIANFALMGGLAVAKLGGIAIDALNTMGENQGYYGLLVLCALSFLVGALLISTVKFDPAPLSASRQDPMT